MVWFSDTSSDRQLLRYVLGLLEVGYSQLKVTDAGFGVTPDGTVAIATLKNERGSAVCLSILADGGARKIDGAITREWEKMRDELSRGEYFGNTADCENAAISDGRVHPNFEGSDVLDYINGATMTHITGIGLAGEH